MGDEEQEKANPGRVPGEDEQVPQDPTEDHGSRDADAETSGTTGDVGNAPARTETAGGGGDGSTQ